MANALKVTIVTITFDDDLGLEKTLSSVAAQTGAVLIEHIVVDGAARQETFEICSDFAHSLAIISEADRGRYDAMNKGIQRSSGDLVWFMHSGDTFGSPNALELVASAVSNPRTEWGYGLARLVDKGGSSVGIMGSMRFESGRFSLGGRPVPHQAAFFGRDLISSVGPYDLSHGLAADQLWILAFSLVSNPIVVPEFLCNFDTSGAGSVRSPVRHFLDMRRARLLLGVSCTGSRWIDSAITAVLCAKELAFRSVGRAIRSL
ncbi:glycosyltransferase [Rhodococcus pseudokoreensis]|uniref:4,4'-diaponeurosporenoate glycosyltransferase n=1 Tax=Rhodococcus pseudokoreensis TaxID=2811421 RepID=A0A974W324_9NOCA|nr:glycosyltransferase [Rhodococcus pseudokoreensis]QSE89737.1 glycosyltransferase [Rhodococcus pseudokoreensis]